MTAAQPSSSTRSAKTLDSCPPSRLFVFNNLRTLFLSCRSFSHSNRLFSIACALFDKMRFLHPGCPCGNSRVAYSSPIFTSHGSLFTARALRPAPKAQIPLSLSPFAAALTHSASRKFFPCHSYANTRDGGATPSLRKLRALWVSALSCSSIFSHRSPLATHHSRPLSLTLFRINTCISVASKRLYLPLESTLTKKPGEGAIIVNQFSFSQNAFSGIGQPQVCSGSLRTHASVSLWESNPALWLWGVQCCPDSLRSVSLWLCGKSSSSEGRQVGETFAFSAHIVAAQFA